MQIHRMRRVILHLGFQHDPAADFVVAGAEPVEHIELIGLKCGEKSERAGVDADELDRRRVVCK